MFLTTIKLHKEDLSSHCSLKALDDIVIPVTKEFIFKICSYFERYLYFKRYYERFLMSIDVRGLVVARKRN